MNIDVHVSLSYVDLESLGQYWECYESGVIRREYHGKEYAQHAVPKETSGGKKAFQFE